MVEGILVCKSVTFKFIDDSWIKLSFLDNMNNSEERL